MFGQMGNPRGTTINSLFQGTVEANVFVSPDGAFRLLGHNLFSDAPGLGPRSDRSHQHRVLLLLLLLADYGGPTMTMALLPGSPAIDAGRRPRSAVAWHQPGRGISRPHGSAPDIGAFESRGFTLTIASGDHQATPTLSPFPAPLVVSVASPFGEPVAGGRVNFDRAGDQRLRRPGAPIPRSSTPTQTRRSPPRLTAAAGAYTVTAQSAGAMDVAFTLTNIGPPTVTGVVSVTRSTRGITRVILGFSEDLIRRSATNRRFFGIASAVQTKHKVVSRQAGAGRSAGCPTTPPPTR